MTTTATAKKPSVQGVHARGHGENNSHLDFPEPVKSYLSQTLGNIEQVVSDQGSLWEVGVRGLQMETAGKIIAGRAFVALRDQLQPGEVAAELARRMIPRSSFYKAIEVYDLFVALPDLRVVQAFAALGITKAMAIRGWGEEDQLALASGKKVRGLTLDAAVDMPTRDFADAIREPELVKASKKIATLEADKEGLQAEVKELKGALKHRYEVLKMPDFAAHARQESVALSEQMMASVTALEELLTDQLASKEAIHTFPEWRDRAAGTMYHSIRAAHARTQALLARMEEEFGEQVTGKIDYEHTLSDGELLIAKEALDVILKRHKTDAENREAKRQNEKGGKGRPRKIKATD